MYNDEDEDIKDNFKGDYEDELLDDEILDDLDDFGLDEEDPDRDS